MALFPRWTNTVARVAGAVALGAPLAVVALLLLGARTPFVTNQGQEHPQPLQFDHRHHAWEQGIDCLYCHSGAERSAVAGVPTVSVCVGCHGQVWNQSPPLEPVRAAFFASAPIRWVKVHDLPDFVYFDHSIHFAKGVGCVSCHGRVEEMAVVRQAAPLTMSWCLDCHRDPVKNLRPGGEVTNVFWTPPVDLAAQQVAWAKAHNVQSKTSCSTCHR